MGGGEGLFKQLKGGEVIVLIGVGGQGFKQLKGGIFLLLKPISTKSGFKTHFK